MPSWRRAGPTVATVGRVVTVAWVVEGIAGGDRGPSHTACGGLNHDSISVLATLKPSFALLYSRHCKHVVTVMTGEATANARSTPHR